jgi:hypothetical protein
MKHWIAFGLTALLFGCDRAPSSFTFVLSGDLEQHVQSGGGVTGSVDNAGFLALDDDAWGVRFALGGLSPGSRTLSKGNGEVVVMSKSSGEVFSSDLGTSCSVWIDPHDSTNGSAITGWFTCDDLASASGKHVTLQGGRFATFISDAANNPKDGTPSPPV